MPGVFNYIADLPNLSLNEDEWTVFVDSFYTNKINDKESLEKILDPKQTHRDEMVDYAAKWFEMRNAILVLNKDLLRIWNRVTNQIMSGDDLLPLTIGLLPNNLKLLKKLSEKINIALKLANGGETECYLTVMHIALTFKIQSLETSKPVSNEPIIDKVLAEFFCELTIVSLEALCIEYLKYLAELFENLVKTHDQFTYLCYFGVGSGLQNCVTAETKCSFAGLTPHYIIIKDVIENYEQQKISVHASIDAIMQKYKIITNLLNMFNHANMNVEEKLQQFSAQFMRVKDILEKNAESSEINLLAKLHYCLGLKIDYLRYGLLRFLPDYLQMDTFHVDVIAKWLEQTEKIKNIFSFFAKKPLPESQANTHSPQSLRNHT